MILNQLTARNRMNTLLAVTALLTAASGLLAGGPTTRPATQPTTPTGKLRAAMPKGWSLQGPMRMGRRNMNPGPHWSRVPAKYVKLRSRLVLTKDGLQREAPPIIVWLAQRVGVKIDPRTSADQQDVELKTTEYLGPGAGIHVYLHLPPSAAKLWTNARGDIAAALGVKLPTTRPAKKKIVAAGKKTVPAGKKIESIESIIAIKLRAAGVSYAFDGVSCRDTKTLAKAMSLMPKDSPLIIQIETNVPYKNVVEVLNAAHKLGVKQISITVIRTSAPPIRPARRAGR
jgi:biopolymer transport protein ExbD